MQSLLKKPQQLKRTLKSAARLKSILKVLVKYGFQDLVQKSNLSSYVPGFIRSQELTSLNTPQRLRLCLEELGPTFIKLGQLLASRPDIVPDAFVEEFKKLQDQVPALPFSHVRPVLEDQYPQGLDSVFSEIDEQSLAAASMAQVHRGRLVSGEEVVLKIQRPGIDKLIHEDMNVLFFVAELFDRYVPELQLFNPIALVEEFSYALSMETNFVIEANNIRRFYENFSEQGKVKIPRPFLQISGPKVLVMEYMQGRRFSEIQKDEQGIDREQLMRTGLQAYLSMVFKDGLFHGDLHGGNVLILPEGCIGLIDFGMVGRLSKKTQGAIANMFVALATEDYDRLAFEYIELSTQSVDVDREEFGRDLRLLLSPFFGLSLKNVNMGKLLIDSAGVAFRHRVYLPSELLLFFKSIVTLEGLGRTIQEDFDILPYIYDFSSEIASFKYDPVSFISDMGFFSREMSSLLRILPSEIKNHFRRLHRADHAQVIEIKGLSQIQKAMSHGAALQFFSVVIGSLVVAGALCMPKNEMPHYYGIPVISLIFFGLATAFTTVAFYHYLRR